MQRIAAFWNRGWRGKAAIIGGIAVGTLVGCCVALLIVALLIPTPARQATAPTAQVPPTAQVVVGGAGGQSTANAPTEAPTPARAPTATQTPAPTATQTPAPTAGPTETPAPPASTLLPAERVRAAVTQALGASNRKVDRVVAAVLDPDVKNPQIYIRWSINDNFTEGLIKGGAQLDATKILKSIAASDVQYDGVLVEGLFPLVDKFGVTKETIVVHAFYKRATIERINWDNFLFKNVYDIADDVTIHPAFRP